jgi:hypothetical protein
MSLRLFFNKLNHRNTRIFPKFPMITKIVLISLITVGISAFAIHAFASNNVLKDTIDGMQAGGNLESWLGKDSLRINSVGMLNALTDIQDAPPDIINGISSTGKLPLWIPGGLVGSATNAVAFLYNPPASGIEYLAQMKDSFLGKSAYAQTGGIGFQGLQPILPIWRAFRNVVYILSSLIFIIIGIMIMLRVKISPQAVINLQNAIPQLITALILVTFSYAIAGLIIDLAYVIQGLTLAVIFNGLGKGLADNLLRQTITQPFSTNFAALSSYNFGTVLWLSIKNLDILVISLIGALIGGIIGAFIGQAAIPVPVLGGIVGAIGGVGVGEIIFAIIICIFVSFLIIKFLFGLIKCYVTLIIAIVLGPLEIGMGAFPNSKMNFSSWIMDVIANIAVFPISLIFLVLVNVIAESSSGLWTPSIIGFAGATANLMPFIIAIGGLMLLPKLPEMIPEFIFKIKPSPWGQAIGEGMGTYLGKPTKFIGQAGAEATGDYIDTQKKGGRGKFWDILGSGVDAARTSGLISKKKP